ncbi:MAG: hypothetical protein ACRC45_00570 [Cetobacterium sp.]
MSEKVAFLFSESFGEDDRNLIEYILENFKDIEPVIVNDPIQSDWFRDNSFKALHKLIPIKGETYWNTAHRLSRASNTTSLFLTGWKDVVAPKKSSMLQKNILLNNCIYVYNVSCIKGEIVLEKISD